MGKWFPAKSLKPVDFSQRQAKQNKKHQETIQVMKDSARISGNWVFFNHLAYECYNFGIQVLISPFAIELGPAVSKLNQKERLPFDGQTSVTYILTQALEAGIPT